MEKCYCVIGYHIWTTSLIDKIAEWKKLNLDCPKVYVFDTSEAGAGLIVGYRVDREFPVPATTGFQEWDYIRKTFDEIKVEIDTNTGETYQGDYNTLFHYNSLSRNIYLVKTNVPHVHFAEWKPDLDTLWSRLYTSRDVKLLQSYSSRVYDIGSVMDNIIKTSEYPQGKTCEELMEYYSQLFVGHL